MSDTPRTDKFRFDVRKGDTVVLALKVNEYEKLERGLAVAIDALNKCEQFGDRVAFSLASKALEEIAARYEVMAQNLANKPPLNHKYEAPKSCRNCRHLDSPLSDDPCFSCHASFVLNGWEPIELVKKTKENNEK